MNDAFANRELHPHMLLKNLLLTPVEILLGLREAGSSNSFHFNEEKTLQTLLHLLEGKKCLNRKTTIESLKLLLTVTSNWAYVL